MKKLDYINGLKGFSCLLVIGLHILLSYYPVGFVGFGMNVPPEQVKSVCLEHYFFSSLSSSNAGLYLFFALIPFVIAVRYFPMHDSTWVRKQATIRYFRFAVPAVAIFVVAWAFYHFNLVYVGQMAQALDNNWLRALTTDNPSIVTMLWHAVSSPFCNRGDYLTVIWCMYLLFYGSMLAYAILLLFGESTHRYRIYGLLALVCLLQPVYLVFWGGLVAGDLYAHGKTARFAPYGTAIAGICFLLLFFPYPIIQPLWLQILIQAVLVNLVILGVTHAPCLQKWLERPFCQWLGQYSFALFLVHMVVVYTLTSWLYIQLAPQYGFGISTAISLLCSVPVTVGASILFEKATGKLTKRIVNLCWTWLQ